MADLTMPGIVLERVTIAGPRRLDGELSYPGDIEPHGSALLINPHPYMGGSMSNNVIQRLHTRLAQNGLVCLRFDYGGVAASEGPAIDVAASMGAFWQTGRAPIDPLLIEDAAIALEWLRERTRTTGAPALVGYSFGAHVAVRVLPSDARAIVLISPTVIHHCFDVGFSRGVPTLVISCDNDFATPAERHEQWLAQVSHDVTAHCCFAGAQHFFMEMEDELAHRITSFVNQAIALARGLG